MLRDPPIGSAQNGPADFFPQFGLLTASSAHFLLGCRNKNQLQYPVFVINFKMVSHTTRTFLLATLLLGSVVTRSEGTVWRRPTLLVPSQSSPVTLLRGGENSNSVPSVPVVPDSTGADATNSHFHSGVARGGSTLTRKPKAAPSKLNTDVRKEATGTPTLPTPVAISLPSNVTAVGTSVTTTATSESEIPDSKRHKRIAKKLKCRNATNIRRKVMHASFGFFFAALNHFIPKAKFVPGMAILTGATLLMELLRYRKGFGWMNDTLHLVLGSSLRKHEMDGKFTGSFYYFLGVTLSSAFYPKACATLGICQLAIADPMASYFGRATRHVYWSRIENGLGGLGRNKGFLGFLGGALCCVPMNYQLLSMAQFGMQPTQSAIWMASFALGFAGAFADLAVPTPTLTLPKKVLGVRVPPFHLDDNTAVPLFSAFACHKVFQLLSFPADLSLAKFLVA